MYRFALRPRWIVGHVIVLGLVFTLANLGLWQLRRLDERREANAQVLRGTRSTVPIDDVLRPNSDEVGSARYQRVRVQGRFDEADELLVRFRTKDGLPGYDVVTPLAVESGAHVLVNRGWVPLDVQAVSPPAGVVEVIGLVRAAEGDGRFRPAREDDRLVVGSLSTPRLEDELDRDLYPGWLQLLEPDEPGSFPEPLPSPDLGEGPHFTYAMQWFVFTTIALIGWLLLVRASARRRAAGPADEAAAR